METQPDSDQTKGYVQTKEIIDAMDELDPGDWEQCRRVEQKHAKSEGRTGGNSTGDTVKHRPTIPEAGKATNMTGTTDTGELDDWLMKLERNNKTEAEVGCENKKMAPGGVKDINHRAAKADVGRGGTDNTTENALGQ